MAIAVASSLFASGQAWAGYGNGGSTNGGAEGPTESGGDGKATATASGIVYDRSKNGTGPKTGAVTPATNWAPPPCWYAPKYTPAQFKKYVEPIWQAESTGHEWDLEQRKRYVQGEPYKDFNLDKAGKGYWWTSFANDSYPPGWDSCDKPTFWVDNGDPPPADTPEAITPEILAQLAYAEVRVPGTEVTLAPEGETKVNLPTWAWLDDKEFKPVSVTARVPVLDIEATTTAEPISLKIDPGTKDAETYPSSGACPIKDGKIGEPYAKGKSDEDPPCGVRYLRSSGDGSYPLKATVTWKISWTGTGVNEPQELPDGEFGADQEVVVEEVQSINR
ncbi:hypothetical protein GCM10010277_32200 [Streptomyces longisporoflavus]|uniref:hypothetical protein n=1 Tax=Streptomyces longisporoflavus TaxID=28044 RepID=UPI0019C8BCB2|nr:hypothetical protein [Streptomyces longisporoflavus]GGV42902.1 hypothetical protein GCM10010277_32200 [Streptomyces longisporoflavus]